MSDTVSEEHGLRCPNCGSDELVYVQATIWARLLAEGTDNSASDTEWDNFSRARCGGCDFVGRVLDCKVEKGASPKHEAAQYGLDYLREALAAFKIAGAGKTLLRIRVAISSAKGAVRHAENERWRLERQQERKKEVDDGRG